MDILRTLEEKDYLKCSEYLDPSLSQWDESTIGHTGINKGAFLNDDEEVTEKEQDYLAQIYNVIINTSTTEDDIEKTTSNNVLESNTYAAQLDDKFQLWEVLDNALNSSVKAETFIPGIGAGMYLIRSKNHAQTLELICPGKNIEVGLQQSIVERLEMIAPLLNIKLINNNFVGLFQIHQNIVRYLNTAKKTLETVFIENTDFVLVPAEKMSQQGPIIALDLFDMNNSTDEKVKRFKNEVSVALFDQASREKIPLNRCGNLKKVLTDTIIKPLLAGEKSVAIQNNKMLLTKDGKVIKCKNASQAYSDMKLLVLLNTTLNEQGLKLEATDTSGKVINFSNSAAQDTTTDPMKILLDKVAGSKEKVKIEGTNFLAEEDANKHIKVYNDSKSEIFKSIANLAGEYGAGLKFIYNKYKGNDIEVFEGTNFEDLVVQVLCDDKCLSIPNAGLIVKKNKSNEPQIDCYNTSDTFDKLELLGAAALNMCKILYLPEFDKPGDMDLPQGIDSSGQSGPMDSVD